MCDWPTATVLLGVLSTVAVAIMRWTPRRTTPSTSQVYASAVSFADVSARLTALEKAHYTFRDEIRDDIRGLEELIRSKE